MIMKMRFKSKWSKGLLVFQLLLTAAYPIMSVTPAAAQAGGINRNGTNTNITTPGFLFEPEVPFTSLKNVPTWSELEQMLDNPYLVTADPATPGNDNGFPSYRTNIIRRPGFGVVLPQFVTHPLNYNPTTGEEMRLINPGFPATNFNVTDSMLLDAGADPLLGPYRWTRENVTISSGASRVLELDEPAPIDYNNPIPADPNFSLPGLPPNCVTSLELQPPEGALLCGGDPGEPRYSGFSIFNSLGYSTPAIRNVANEGTTISAIGVGNHRLFDPNRGFITPRDTTTGAGGLNKPSIRIPGPNGSIGGTPAIPNYLVNAGLDPLVDVTTHSNENDYIQNKAVAIALGKSLFWDMQVGSDGVQSCGTCHFNGTGTDTRTKNQLNPNHINNNDTLLQIGDTPNLITGGMSANYTLKPGDFPLMKLTNPEVAGDPACSSAPGGVGVLRADATLIPYAGPIVGTIGPAYLASQRFSNPVTGLVTVCDASNKISDVNDVVSSMGVVFNKFIDIAPVDGTFQTPVNGVAAVRPDVRTTGNPLVDAEQAVATDPLPVFQGLRRVEPRNTPTMQAGGFNFDNFWDGRARHDFNGGSVFGAADPQSHVWVNDAGTLTATRQIIRFVSIASLATGPGLSEFEMSFAGRNWSKIGKKLLQAGAVPLANQLVDPTDSVLGPYSNQPGAGKSPLCTDTVYAVGKPGLCLSYNTLIQNAYYPALWSNTTEHLNGCYTDGNAALHPNQCSAVGVTVDVPVLSGAALAHSAADPFDGYVLSIGADTFDSANTNQFTQMEGNFSLFWGLSIQSWVNILVPDNTPFDQFLDANPDAFETLGEPGEPGLVADQLNCGGNPNQRFCFRPVGRFLRDPQVRALRNPVGEGGAGGLLVSTGNSGPRRGPNDPDPLLGLDIFFASNLSLKNPNFRTGRCGECHAIPTLTDHTMPFTSKINLMDAVAEFATPGIELIVEPLARLRVISGFLLEAEINENGQDAVERRFVDQSLIPNPQDGLAYPGGLNNPAGTAVGNDGNLIPATLADANGRYPYAGADAAFLDNGIYNLGVRPTVEDLGRGGTDAFGWPLSISTLMMKNLAGIGYNPGGDNQADGFAQPGAPGIQIGTFDPSAECFGLWEPTAQDPRINPGCEGEPANPLLPPYLSAFVNNITVGDFPPELDEAGGAIGGMLNTLTDVSMIEGFMDSQGPFNPANPFAEVLNFGGFSDRPGDITSQMGTWPNVNRVGRMGSFKAAPLRNVELTGPYFHNGGKLTLRQVVDFYTRGGDFPVTNAAHRDFNLVNQNVEIQSNLNEAEKVALVDFLLELTDERNRFDRAPFDHPEVIIPIDGLAPDNTTGRAGLLALTTGGACTPATATTPASGACFRSVPAVGAAGQLTPEPTFMNVTKVRLVGSAANRGSAECDFNGTGTGRVSHYCH